MENVSRRCGSCFLAVLVMFVTLAKGADMPPDLPGLVIEAVVSDSPAAKAGLKVGDRLLSYDGKPLPSPAALQAAQENTFDKKEIALRVQRGRETLMLAAPPGRLEIEVRPVILPASLQLYQEGKVSLQAKKTEEAILKWTAASRAAQGEGDNLGGAWLYGLVGAVYADQRLWKEANTAQAMAWALLKESSDAGAQALALENLGRYSENLNDFSAAVRWYEQELQVDTAAGYEWWAARAINNLGIVAGVRGDLAAAQDYFTRALEIRGRLASGSLDVANTLNNLGLVASGRGDLAAAQDYHTRALEIRERLAPGSTDVAGSLNNLGIVAYGRGDLAAAQDYYTRALEIRERLEPGSLEVASILNNLGLIVADRGDLAAAQDCHTRALEIRKRLASGSLDVAKSLHNLGLVAAGRGDLAAAQDYYTRALEIRKRLAPGSLDVADSLNNLGNAAAGRGDLATAQDCQTLALEIRERLAPGSLSVASSLHNLGIVAHKRGDRAAAQNYLDRALAIKERQAPGSLSVADSLNNLGVVAGRRGDLAAARDYYARAVEIIEKQRGRIPSTEARALLLAQHTDLYAGLLRTYLALNDSAKAFATVERARARSLVELLAERRLDFRADAPADLLKQQDELDRQRSAAYAALVNLDPRKKDDERTKAEQAKLVSLERQQRDLTADIKRASPRIGTLLYPDPLDLKGAQAALDSGTLLLVYYADEKQTYLFAVTKDGQKVFTLPVGSAELTKQVRRFRNAVAVPRLGLGAPHDFEVAHEQGQKLYDTLVRPAQEWIDEAQRVLICPDEALRALPFAALVSQTKPRPRYFIEDKPLHTIASTTVYAETRKWASSSNSKLEMKLLAFGDALYTKEQAEAAKGQKPGQAAQKPGGEGKGVASSNLEVAEAQRGGLKLDRLKETRTEVMEIAKLFGDSAMTKLGQDATKTAAQQESPSYTILHFAVHGWFDEQTGLNSGLAFSQPEALGAQAKAGDNGLWQAWEIFEKAHLNADLVALSACQTGLGQELRGEGLVGLTWAFQYAGAKSLVVSLWEVADPSTAELMTAFYKELRGGKSKDEALRKAMEAVRSKPKWAHPYYWSPFILVGDWK